MSYLPRFEFKYRLSPLSYQRIRNSVRLHATLDHYSLKDPDGRYFVRSLYYDTDDYRAYAEKLSGESNRIKLRVRTYSREEATSPFVSVELKTRSNALITKFGTHVPTEQYTHYVRTGHWPDLSDPVLVEAERLTRLQALRPKVLVDYRREAFVPRDASGVRITFDHDLRYASSTDLFPQHAFFHNITPHRIVLEIKATRDYPAWVDRFAVAHGLKAVPNSKYADAVEQSEPVLLY